MIAENPTRYLLLEVLPGEKRHTETSGCEPRKHIQTVTFDDAVETHPVRSQPLEHKALQAGRF